MSFKKYLRNKLPNPESFTDNRFIGWLAPWISHPRLWHLNRRSVALGVAIGMVTGLFPAPFQILSAVLVSIPCRANIPAAAFTTLYTNPFTFFPLYLLAYKIGSMITGEQTVSVPMPGIQWSFMGLREMIPNLFSWFVALGNTLLIGLAIEATLFAICGYAATMLVWRIAIARQWRNRHR